MMWDKRGQIVLTDIEAKVLFAAWCWHDRTGGAPLPWDRGPTRGWGPYVSNRYSEALARLERKGLIQRLDKNRQPRDQDQHARTKSIRLTPEAHELMPLVKAQLFGSNGVSGDDDFAHIPSKSEA